MRGSYIRVFAGILMLAAVFDLSAQTIVRGPYLQQVTEQSVIVRWRTSSGTVSVVRYGLDSGSLSQTATVSGSRTEHAVLLSGLSDSTTYFYSVGDESGALAGDTSFYFTTAPEPGTPAPARFWVLGDSGTANGNAANVRDAFKAWSASQPADFMIMLGDNAYNSGTDAEYQAAVFDMYPEILRQLPLWSTLGNHDGYSADSATQTGPYYDIFNLPVAGEAGGLPSGTEAYYSFDYGNVHFICLDSYESDRSTAGNMLQWLESDLAFNDKPWVIAFWHHPPYTKGSHDSDSEGALIDMRQNALPILEAWGVDLVLSGHSHSYERSYLLDGHYGASSTLDPVENVLNPGDGRISGTGAYQKPGVVAAEHAGAVYAVAGSSGKISSGPLNHPAMFVNLIELGSMVIDVSGSQMDAVFIDDSGAVLDEFTLIKTPDTQPPLLEWVGSEDATHVRMEYSERVVPAGAGDPSNYAIPGLAILTATVLDGNRAVRLETSAMSVGETYTLSVSNVFDESGNRIADGTSQSFVFEEIVTRSFQDGLAPSPDYAGTRDTYIREASPSVNYGSAVSLQVDGDDGGGDMNILVAWDLSEVPTSATVQSASIHFNTLNPGGPYECYGLRAPWIEDEVTWLQAASGSAWSGPGASGVADRDPVPICTFNAGSTGPLEIPLTADALSLVQSWVDGAIANHGLLLANSATANGADFDARESSAALQRPRLEITYSVAVVPPNQAPNASFTHDCADLQCEFADTSTDLDGSVVSWSWDLGDGTLVSGDSAIHLYGAPGEYTVELTVTDDDGATDTASVIVAVTEPPAEQDHFVVSEIPGSGSVSGDFSATFAADDALLQTITERSSGGKKQDRYSYLVHTWVFDLPTSSVATLHARAWSGASADGDAFELYGSMDNVNYTKLSPVPGSSAESLLVTLPVAVGGPFYLQVIDTDRTPGNLSLDSVIFDELFIRTSAPEGDPPASPSGLSAMSLGAYEIQLSWTDNSSAPDAEMGFRLQRSEDGVNFADLDIVGENVTTYLDTALTPATTYHYRVYAFNSAGNSGYSNTAFATTDDGISLSLSGSKVKGKHVIQATWAGAGGNVVLIRDGSVVDTGEVVLGPEGVYNDETGNKGGRTYQYQVCEAGGSASDCSALVEISF